MKYVLLFFSKLGHWHDLSRTGHSEVLSIRGETIRFRYNMIIVEFRLNSVTEYFRYDRFSINMVSGTDDVGMWFSKFLFHIFYSN